MANVKKKLQNAATTKFRRENPNVHTTLCSLIRGLASYIRKTGNPEATVGITYGHHYYEYANE